MLSRPTDQLRTSPSQASFSLAIWGYPNSSSSTLSPMNCDCESPGSIDPVGRTLCQVKPPSVERPCSCGPRLLLLFLLLLLLLLLLLRDMWPLVVGPSFHVLGFRGCCLVLAQRRMRLTELPAQDLPTPCLEFVGCWSPGEWRSHSQAGSWAVGSVGIWRITHIIVSSYAWMACLIAIVSHLKPPWRNDGVCGSTPSAAYRDRRVFEGSGFSSPVGHETPCSLSSARADVSCVSGHAQCFGPHLLRHRSLRAAAEFARRHCVSLRTSIAEISRRNRSIPAKNKVSGPEVTENRQVCCQGSPGVALGKYIDTDFLSQNKTHQKVLSPA
ncbi:hypothetical protein VTK73DRAFT_1036 [Phialemonium thermophilum]|uniref:Uncharacterized protein n=1 Tax=Phialemonium thermophilum TaxID=223376 RepID=A0ABR3VTZ2_9PEZI